MHALSYLDLLLRLRNLFEDKCRQIRGTRNNSQQKRKKNVAFIRDDRGFKMHMTYLNHQGAFDH